MNKLKIILLSLGALLILTVTFFAGAFLGASESYMQNSAFRGVLLVTDLRQLRDKEIDKQVSRKELNLNQEILMALETEENGLAWVLFPFFHDKRKFFEYMARYRQQYPSTLNDDPLFVSANKKLIKQYVKENSLKE